MLSPYTVLDLSDDRGEMASMILGDLGANVVKVEPPYGSSSRRMGPFLEDAPEPENSLQFFAFNRNKRGVTLDVTTKAGRAALLRLAEKADFVIESAGPGEMAKLGLGFDAFEKANPSIIYVAISAFGQDGPHADYAASDLTFAAMGGPMSVQGNPERAPVRLSVPQAWLHASSEAAVAALTAHALMIQTGQGQFVDVSAQTSMIATMLHARLAHAIQGSDMERAGSVLQAGAIELPLVHECADGYVVLIPTGATMTGMLPWMVEDGIVPEEWIEGEDWATYDRRFLQQQPVVYALEDVFDAIRRYVLLHTKADMLDRGLRDNVTIAPINTVEDLTKFHQLEERGYWLMAPLPDGTDTAVAGILAQLSETPLDVKRWAPKLGQHNHEILIEMLGMSEAQAIEGGATIPQEKE